MIYFVLIMVMLFFSIRSLLRSRQVTSFVTYLMSQATIRHLQRMVLVSQGEDPDVVEYHDITACFDKFGRLPVWSTDFQQCEVFKTLPCDY
jgi:hypothetical protein